MNKLFDKISRKHSKSEIINYSNKWIGRSIFTIGTIYSK